MASTTVNGVGSGIDIQGIVKSLVDADRAPKQTQINTQSQKATTQLSSIGKIQSALDAFRGAIKSMTDDNSFSGLDGYVIEREGRHHDDGEGGSQRQLQPSGQPIGPAFQVVDHNADGGRLYGGQQGGYGHDIIHLPVGQEVRRECSARCNLAAGA